MAQELRVGFVPGHGFAGASVGRRVRDRADQMLEVAAVSPEIGHQPGQQRLVARGVRGAKVILGLDQPSAEEVWVYLGVSDFGEVVEQRAFRLGPVYDPKVDRVVAEGHTPVVYLSYGARKHRQTARIEIDLQGLRVRGK